MRPRHLLTSLFGVYLSLLGARCTSATDAYVVLNVDVDATVDKSTISQIDVSVGSETRHFVLTSSLPGSLGVATSRSGSLTVAVLGVGNQTVRGAWSGMVVATAGRTSTYAVTLSCSTGLCGTAVGQPDGGGSGFGGASGSDVDSGTPGDAGGASGTGMAGSGGASGAGGTAPDTVADHMVRCGTTPSIFCDNRTQACCRKSSSAGADLDFHCTDFGVCGTEGRGDTVEQKCNTGKNCPADQACNAPATVDARGVQVISCVPKTRTAWGYGDSGSVLCANTAECPGNHLCVFSNPSGTPLSYLGRCTYEPPVQFSCGENPYCNGASAGQCCLNTTTGVQTCEPQMCQQPTNTVLTCRSHDDCHLGQYCCLTDNGQVSNPKPVYGCRLDSGGQTCPASSRICKADYECDDATDSFRCGSMGGGVGAGPDGLVHCVPR